MAPKASRGNLVRFPSRHKWLILSHRPKHYETTGKWVAQAKTPPLKELYQKYQVLLVEALLLKTTPKKNSNVLQHTMGYLKEQLSSDKKQELLDVIDYDRREYTPFLVPITLFTHYARKSHQPYLKGQVYLRLHPMELRLRNHV